MFESNVSEESFLENNYSPEASPFLTIRVILIILHLKNAIFGDFKDIRNAGFYRRYLHNVKLTSTYIKAYQLTENEYVETFGKKRYASYDSFRIVKNRIIKKE